MHAIVMIENKVKFQYWKKESYVGYMSRLSCMDDNDDNTIEEAMDKIKPTITTLKCFFSNI